MNAATDRQYGRKWAWQNLDGNEFKLAHDSSLSVLKQMKSITLSGPDCLLGSIFRTSWLVLYCLKNPPQVADA